MKVHSEIQLSFEEILEGISQLNTPEIEYFLGEIGTILAKRKASNLPVREAELLLKINQGLPSKKLQEFDRLSQKLDKETLTEKEHEQLLHLSDEMEKLDAKRMEYLIELANLRSISVDKLLEDLGLISSKSV